MNDLARLLTPSLRRLPAALAAVWQGLPGWVRDGLWSVGYIIVLFLLPVAVPLLFVLSSCLLHALWDLLPAPLRWATIVLGVTELRRVIQADNAQRKARAAAKAEAARAAAKAEAARAAMPLSPVPDTAWALRLLWDDPTD